MTTPLPSAPSASPPSSPAKRSKSPLQRLYGRAHRAFVRALNRMGWVVARTSDYYSPLRPLAELEGKVDRWFRPSRMGGIDFDLEAMMSRLEAMLVNYGAEYLALPPYGELKGRKHGPGFTEVDAFVLYLMLRHHKPARYLEIGSGLSTEYALLAAAQNAAEGRAMRMTVVDPFMTPATRAHAGIDAGVDAGVEVLPQEAQDLPLERFAELRAGDVLFIDSTHIVRIDGEVPYLVLEVLPALNPGVLVHVHDVHFPFNVPCHPGAYLFDRRWPMPFTEAMLVQAYLSGNPRVAIEMSTPLLRHHQEGFLRRVVPGYRPLDPEDFDTHHGSLWLRCRDLEAAAKSAEKKAV